MPNSPSYSSKNVVRRGSREAYNLGDSPPNRNLLLDKINSVANQLIVKPNDRFSSADIDALSENLNVDISVLETTHWMGIQLWEVSGMASEKAIGILNEDPRFEYVESNDIKFTNQAIPTDPLFDQLWGLNNTGQTGGTPDADIDVPEAWDIQTGNEIVIGVIDTGVDYTHPDLQNNMWTNPGEIPDNGLDDDDNGFVDDYYGYDFVNDDGDPFDDDGHGTHVSGTIAAEGNNGIGVTGVNWDAQIMGLKFLDRFGSGSIFDAIQAIEYSIMMGADITNNSWGGGGFNQGLVDAIAAAGEAGQLFVAAAGNSGLDTDIFPEYPAAYELDNIISVAATNDDDDLAGFSNFGATSVDLGAPGVGILSTVPGNNYELLNGTSMAAPHVTGVASLLLSEFPGLSADEVKQRILETIDPIPALDGQSLSGGRLNAFNALSAPNAGGIEGKKWNDLNQNGMQDGGEPGLENWTIFLDENENGELDEGESSTVTDADGKYAFNFLEAGKYVVAEVVKPGWTPTAPESGSQTVRFEAGENIAGIDFGNYLANPAKVRGIKWNDLDEDGIKDGGEPGVEGWTIYLDNNSNGELDEGEQSTVTDANGKYTFTNLEPGIYTVAEELLPGWEQTFPEIGFIEELFRADFSDANEDPSLDGFTIDNTGATEEGLWHLSVGRGEQLGHSADDSMYFGQGEGPDGGGNYDAGDTAGRITSPDIDLTAARGAELSFNYFLETEGGAPIFDSARVLVSENGSPFSKIVSNPSQLGDPTTGWTNAVVDLTPYVGNTIQLQFDFQTGDETFNEFEGWYVDDITVNNIGTGAHTVALAPGEKVKNLNFGNFELVPGSISGTKWNDLDSDGQRDDGEPGLEGWTIYLDQNQNDQLDDGELFDVTDGNGEYSFLDLPVDTYIVAEVLQEGWQPTFPVTFEYEFTDSNQPNGPTFDWVDISGDGTELNLFDDDFANVDLPFAFPFFEVEQDTVNVSSNGYLAFESEAIEFINAPIPDLAQPNNYVAPFWDDLDPSAGGSIYYYNDDAEDRFIVQYQDIPRLEDGGSLTFEVILESDGSILYQYEEMHGTLDSATVGVENLNGTDGLEIAFNESYVEDGLAVSIEPAPGILDPYSVVVGSNEMVTGIDFGNQQISPPSPTPGLPIFGTPNNDELNIFDGSTIVLAGDGNDIVDASQSSGSNQLFGGGGDDELFASTNDRLFGEAGNDILNAAVGSGENRLFGGDNNDILFAGVNDRLFGEGGDDVLFAGEGDSLLNGGQQADQFWIANASLPSSPNTITDFELGTDVIGIGGLGLSFEDLSLTHQAEDTLIAALNTDIAILTGIQASYLSSSNFVFV